jgi:hypothetical protein
LGDAQWQSNRRLWASGYFAVSPLKVNAREAANMITENVTSRSI